MEKNYGVVPLHFAAALKKPLIAIMDGHTKADRTGHYGSDKATVLVTRHRVQAV